MEAIEWLLTVGEFRRGVDAGSAAVCDNQHMRRLLGKEIALMSVPALFLVGVGLFYPGSAPPLVLNRTQVTTIPLKERNKHNPYYQDTRLIVDIGCKKPPLLGRILSKGMWTTRPMSHKPDSTYLMDASGHKYEYLKSNGGSIYVGYVHKLDMPKDGRSISYTHEFNLAQIPVSAGKISFITTYIDDDGFELPVSVEVRS